jgi:RimJ/RimL family protein N-acetyltransferase
MRVPPLTTERLIVRPFVMEDLEAIYGIADVELGAASAPGNVLLGDETREARRAWLQWTVLNYEELDKLYQPPYGDRAVVLKETRALVGAVGFVPCLNAFGQLPSFRRDGAPLGLNTPEFGLFWMIAPAFQRRGYATEAARAMIAFAFEQLRLQRIVATTSYENAASMRVMEKLGMRIERNPSPGPPWLQVVGILENKEPPPHPG